MKKRRVASFKSKKNYLPLFLASVSVPPQTMHFNDSLYVNTSWPQSIQILAWTSRPSPRPGIRVREALTRTIANPGHTRSRL